MKTSIKLLLSLLVIVIGILSFVNYSLAQQYSLIDTEDKFYEYDKYLDLSFESIELNGGNRVQVLVEKGEENALYIHKEMKEEVQFKAEQSKLLINFNGDYTDSINAPETIDTYFYNAQVVITYQNLKSLKALNSQLVFDYETQKTPLDLSCEGSTWLQMNINELQGGNLDIHASGKSYLIIEQNIESKNIENTSINLMDETFLKMTNVHTDSADLEMSNQSRINCDNEILKKLM
jgi:predicted nucleotidyltransferase